MSCLSLVTTSMGNRVCLSLCTTSIGKQLMPLCQSEFSIDIIRIYVLVNCTCKFYLFINKYTCAHDVRAGIHHAGMERLSWYLKWGGSEYFSLIFSTSDKGRVLQRSMTCHVVISAISAKQYVPRDLTTN
jgi:hypothetical protein